MATRQCLNNNQITKSCSYLAIISKPASLFLVKHKSRLSDNRSSACRLNQKG
jgi:hypothetical protein